MRSVSLVCAGLLIVGWTALSSCAPASSGREQASSSAKSSTRRYVGELERLGKDGQDILVLGVDATGFEMLSLRQKQLAYYLYRAAIAGNAIFTEQMHPRALEIQLLLEEIHLHSGGLTQQAREAVSDYLKYIW